MAKSQSLYTVRSLLRSIHIHINSVILANTVKTNLLLSNASNKKVQKTSEICGIPFPTICTLLIIVQSSQLKISALMTTKYSAN